MSDEKWHPAGETGDTGGAEPNQSAQAPGEPPSYEPPDDATRVRPATQPGGYAPPANPYQTPPAAQGYPATGYTPPSSAQTPAAAQGYPATGYTPPSSAQTPPPAQGYPATGGYAAPSAAPEQGFAAPATSGYTPPSSGQTPPPPPTQGYPAGGGLAAPSSGQPAAQGYPSAGDYAPPASGQGYAAPGSYGSALSGQTPPPAQDYPAAGQYGSAGGYQQPAQGFGAPGSYNPTVAGEGYQQPPQPYGQPASDPSAAPPAAGGYQPSGYPGQPGGYPQPGYPAPNAAMFGNVPLADWPKRAIGGLIDYVAPGLVCWVIGAVIQAVLYQAGAWSMLFLGTLVYYLLLIAWMIVYLGYKTGTTGVTFGRSIAKVKVVSEQTGAPIGVQNGMIRQAAHIIDSLICAVGWLFPLWDAKRQTIADKVCKTVVIDNSADPSAGSYQWN